MTENGLAVLAVLALALLGLLGANALQDRGGDASLARRLAAVVGGGAYLLAVLRLDVWVAILLAVTMAVVILVLRLGFSRQLRGVRGRGGEPRWGEAAFSLGGAASLAVGWAALGDPWLAFVPIGFMAWGDNAAGVVRDRLAANREKSLLPSAAMLAACLLVAWLYQPYWAAAAGAVAATAAERFHPTDHPLWDDNWTIIAASLATLIGVGAAVGARY